VTIEVASSYTSDRYHPSRANAIFCNQHPGRCNHPKGRNCVFGCYSHTAHDSFMTDKSGLIKWQIKAVPMSCHLRKPFASATGGRIRSLYDASPRIVYYSYRNIMCFGEGSYTKFEGVGVESYPNFT
jgi:hypothetical protein